jgi:peptidoglycan-N-acetylglucosamine deacetylase
VAIPEAVLAIPAVAGIYAWGACHPASQVFGRTLTRVQGDKALALTFDDGPNPATTPALLDVLERYDAHATFFLIGRYVRACPDLAAEIARRGHFLGNHTETHPNLLWRSSAQIFEELARCALSILQATGQRPRVMRPPYGYRGPQLHAAARRAGLDPPIMWSKTGRDWTGQSLGRLIRRLATVGAGDILLLHDGYHGALGADRSQTVEALQYWLPRWKSQGLNFVSIERSPLTP